MIGNIRLYKSLGLKQDNTMYFASLQDQQTFFNAPPNVQFTDYENVSYNGARAFKININFVSFMFLEYDYLRFEFPNDDGTTRTIYAFIDEITYVNDNCCAIQSTIDLMQTFMFEMFDSYQYGVVKNYTLKQNAFNTYIPYVNKYPVSDYKYSELGNFLLKKTDVEITSDVGYIAITFDQKITSVEGFNFYDIKCIDNGLSLPFIKILIPVTLTKNQNGYQIDETTNYGFHFSLSDTEEKDIYLPNLSSFYLSDLYQKGQAFILDISFVSSSICGETLGKNTLGVNTIYYPYNMSEKTDYQGYYGKYFNIIRTSDTQPYFIQVIENKPQFLVFDLTSYIDNLSLARQPYYSIFLGNGYENISISLLDFFDEIPVQPLTNNVKLQLNYIQSLTFPSQIAIQPTLIYGEQVLTFKPKNIPLIIGGTDNIIYSTSAWATYVSQNRSFAYSGLATQQSYEKQAFDRQIKGEKQKYVVDAFVGSAKAIAGAVLGSPEMLIRSTSDVVGGGAKTLVGIETKQDVFALEQAKDRAMQQIQFNDIKTSPSQYSNLSSAISNKVFANKYAVSVYLVSPRNINDVKKYHEIYGYEINKTLDNFSFASIRNHENFDYISFVSLFIKANIPRDMEETIEQILTNGVRFWYDYTKFLDYSLPNNEVT